MLTQGRDLRSPKTGTAADLPSIVYLVDDDSALRESLESLITTAGWQPETFASGEEFLGIERLRRASCLLLDYSLPDLNGLQIQQRLMAERPDMPIIFITGHCDVPTTVKAMKAGAVEFLTKPFQTEVLLEAIQKAIERSHVALQHAARVAAIRARYDSLSVREKEVMEWVACGLMNKQVAAELGISEITVKAYRGRVMEKMCADSLAELVKMDAILRINGLR